MKMTNTTIKFKGALQMKDADYDFELTDINDRIYSLEYIMDEALGHEQTIYIVDEDLDRAEVVANALNKAYEKEVEKMVESGKMLEKVGAVAGGQMVSGSSVEDEAISSIERKAKKQVNKTIEGENEMTKNNVEVIRESEAAKRFLERTGGDMYAAKNATKSNKSNEKGANKVTRKSVGTKSNTNMGVERNQQEQTPTRRLSSGAAQNALKAKREKAMESRGLSFDDSVRGEMKKVSKETPWYLRSEDYDVINRLETILADRKDKELGITDVRFLNPKDVLGDYDNGSVLVVVEISFGNGVNLRFRIKENTNERSYSDVASSNITWKQAGKSIKPVYTIYKKNEEVFSVKCCDTQIQVSSSDSEITCSKCQSVHQVVGPYVLMDGQEASIAFRGQYVQTQLDSSHIEINKDVLALAMACGQYFGNFSMHGVISE
ncbi:hypothetical protein KLEB273_gp276 [Bacillus phage vB_BauM_KLEB27-3]|nr:hypothetical protein KLEB273_gp276 [Bacillus phage vB_BauM_KLEB27-3]